MKATTFFIGLVLGFLASTAQAEGELAIYRFSAGFSPRPYMMTITIFENGTAVYEKVMQTSSGGNITMELDPLSARELRNLKTAVVSIRPADLVDTDAGAPKCTDAPSVRYSVVQSSNADPVTVKGRWSCHDYEMPRSQSAAVVVKMLDDLRAEAEQ